MSVEFSQLLSTLTRIERVKHTGSVCAVHGGVIHVAGLSDHAGIGDLISLPRRSRSTLWGEVLRIDAQSVQVLAHGTYDGVRKGDHVTLHPTPPFAPDRSWIGRVLDPFGCPLDGKPAPIAGKTRSITPTPPPTQERRALGSRLTTQLAVFNTVLPIVSGQRIGLFAGSGVGKSQLLAQLANGIEADVVVIALIGERGREVNEFVQQTMGPNGMKRAVVIAATSDQSPLSRRRCAWSAMAVAEFFRDCGRSVLLLADSITRFAEAHREIAIVSGEAPSLRGFPPSVSANIMSLCERAGPGLQSGGDITAIFSVLVAGSDMDEPVADILRGALDGHVVLSREIAERGRYPAVDLLRSVSRSLPSAATSEQNALIADVRALLGRYEHSEAMIRAGLYVEGTDPLLDRAVRVWPDLDAFLARASEEGIEDSFARLALLLRRGKSQIDLVSPDPRA